MEIKKIYESKDIQILTAPLTEKVRAFTIADNLQCLHAAEESRFVSAPEKETLTIIVNNALDLGLQKEAIQTQLELSQLSIPDNELHMAICG